MNTIISLLNPNNTLVVNRPLAHAIGVSEAIIYSALLSKYVYYESNDILKKGGWFFSTAPDLEESTGLSEKQQSRCINNLAKLGLIETQKRGMPAKRHFRIINDVNLIKKLLADGEKKMYSIKSEATICYNKKRQVVANSGACSSETEEQESTNVGICSSETAEHAPSNCSSLHVPNGATCSAESSEYIIKTKENKTKSNESKGIHQSIHNTPSISENLKPSVNNMNDSIDSNASRNARQGISVERRDECQERIRRNIDYDELVNDKRGLKREIDNIIAIMTDVICSQSRFIHVNGEEMPHEVVEKRYLELTYEDIDYILNAIQNKANKINNIRSYLITALYNSHATQSIGAFAEACTEM